METSREAARNQLSRQRGAKPGWSVVQTINGFLDEIVKALSQTIHGKESQTANLFRCVAAGSVS